MSSRRHKFRLMPGIALISLLICSALPAQSPEKISYQAVVRNADGVLLANQSVGIRIQVLQSSEFGAAVYVETHTRPTNANGLVTLEIGGGTVVMGSFNGINWSAGPYFLKTEIDPAGGTSYSIIGTTQLLSVPYALHAKTVATEADPIFLLSPASGITGTNINNWNAAFGWGNHTGLYRPVSWLPSWMDVTGKPATFAPEEHAHSAEDIKSGTLAVERGGTGLASFTKGNFILASSPTTLEERTPEQVRGDIGAAASSHAHGNITNTGSIGSTAGRIVTTGSAGTLQATAGTAAGQILYWNGTAWINVAPGATGQVLTLMDGVPTWTGSVAGTNDIINPATGKIWMDRNLGASQVATSGTDADSYGDLYQWGRRGYGHQIRTSGTTTTLSSSNSPNHGDFILAPSSPYDWRSPQNDNLWQGISGTNNPCPTGYRLPTEAEWNAERLTWSTTNAAGAFASPLKLPVAGYRHYGTGSFSNVGSIGYYWASTVFNTNSYYLHFSSSLGVMNAANRAYGFSVRCLKDY